MIMAYNNGREKLLEFLEGEVGSAISSLCFLKLGYIRGRLWICVGICYTQSSHLISGNIFFLISLYIIRVVINSSYLHVLYVIYPVLPA